MILLLTGARSPAVCKANTTQSVDHINVFLRVGHSAIGGQMHSIGSTKLAHVNTEFWLKLVTPLAPLHGYRDYVYMKKTSFPKISPFCGPGEYYGFVLAMQIILYYPKEKCFKNI